MVMIFLQLKLIFGQIAINFRCNRYYFVKIIGLKTMEPEQEDDAMRQKRQAQEQTQTRSDYVYVYKKHPKRIKYKINTSRYRMLAQLKLVQMIIKENQWLEVSKGGDLMWSGLQLTDQGTDVALQMKVNRIPSMHRICGKKTMGFILNKFKQYWPQQFWFQPKTYSLPEEQERLANKIKKGGVFIAKPSEGSMGDGINLIQKISELPKIGSQWTVQPYIDNPLLLENKKFDFRLYVIIASIDPYICYLNQQGLARFCTEDYVKPTKQNFKNPYIHLTNYSLNKNSPNYKISQQAFSRGSKRCLRTVWQDLLKLGVDVGGLKERIVQLAQKFLIGIYPLIKYYYTATFPKKNGKNFQVLGIDVLVDDKLNPWLLQANHNPSLSTEHKTQQLKGAKYETKKSICPVDEYVKRIVVQDSIYVAMRSLQKQKQMQIGQLFYSYRKILDADSEEIVGMNVIENMLKLFHSLCGIRSKQVLTSSQFIKLSKLDGTTSEKINKNDYHLIFVKIMRNKQNSTQMEFQNFIEAIEYIISQVVGFNKQNKLVIMQEHMNHLVSQL